MLKNIPLLIIPLIFTFTFDHYFIKDNSLDHINPHPLKNISTIINNNNLKISPSIINEFYSEKIIQGYEDEKIIKLIPKFKKYVSNKNDKINLNNLNENTYLTSLNWEKNFSNKKIDFIENILPLITFENKKIIQQRKNLIEIKLFLSQEKTLSATDLKYIRKLSKKYKVSSTHKHKIDIVNELLLSVNIIPNSIVLAQAVNESGWGTSRFAKEYNALFGQYTYDKNAGVIPYKREKGKKHLIKNFTSINKSVESYFNNINSHYAYKEFRRIRSEISDFNNDFNIKMLTSSLNVYAEDKSYVDTINKIIDSNNLNQFDSNLSISIGL